MVRLELIEDVSGLRGLEDAWLDLLQRSDAASIYVTPEWMRAWWQVFSAGRRLFVVAAWDGSLLVGLAPLLLRRVFQMGCLPFRRLEFIGTGERESDEVGSNYLDILLDRTRETEIASLLWDAILGQWGGRWDEAVLVSTRSESVALSVGREKVLRRASDRVEILRTTPCLYAPLPPDWEQYLVSLGYKTRRNLRHDRRVLEARGPLSYELHEGDAALQRFEDFLSIHRRRWASRSDRDAFSSQRFMQFLCIIVSEAARQRWLWVGLLRHHGRIIAGSCHFAYLGTVYGYQVGCDVDYDPKLGLGKLEFGFSIEQAILRGYRSFDFYKAKLGGYKPLLAKGQRDVVDIRFAHQGIRDELLYFLHRVKDQAKTRLGRSRRAAAENEASAAAP